MATISVKVRRLDFPEWVQKAYDDMHPVEKEDLIKAMIYSQIEPLKSKNEEGKQEFEISQVLRDGANRVPILDDMGECLWALGMATTTMAWGAMDKRKEVKVIDETIEKEEKDEETEKAKKDA